MKNKILLKVMLVIALAGAFSSCVRKSKVVKVSNDFLEVDLARKYDDRKYSVGDTLLLIGYGKSSYDSLLSDRWIRNAVNLYVFNRETYKTVENQVFSYYRDDEYDSSHFEDYYRDRFFTLKGTVIK